MARSVLSTKSPSGAHRPSKAVGLDMLCRPLISVSRFVSSSGRCLVRRLSLQSGMGFVPAARDRVGETTDGAAHDVRRDHGVSQCRGGLAPAVSLKVPADGQAASVPVFRRCRGLRWQGPRLARW